MAKLHCTKDEIKIPEWQCLAKAVKLLRKCIYFICYIGYRYYSESVEADLLSLFSRFDAVSFFHLFCFRYFLNPVNNKATFGRTFRCSDATEHFHEFLAAKTDGKWTECVLHRLSSPRKCVWRLSLKKQNMQLWSLDLPALRPGSWWKCVVWNGSTFSSLSGAKYTKIKRMACLVQTQTFLRDRKRKKNVFRTSSDNYRERQTQIDEVSSSGVSLPLSLPP